MLDVFSNTFLVPTDRADTVPSRPKASAKQSASCPQDVTVDSDRTFPFQKPNCVRNTVFWGNVQQHMNVVRHGLPFQKLDTTLLTQLSKYLPNTLANLPIKDFSAILRDDHNMILAFPLHACLTLPILHMRSSLPFGGLLREDAFIISTTDMAKPRKFSPGTTGGLIGLIRAGSWTGLLQFSAGLARNQAFAQAPLDVPLPSKSVRLRQAGDRIFHTNIALWLIN